MYIGDKEISKIVGQTVYFADGSEKEYTSTQLKYLQTDEPKDASQLRQLMAEQVMPQVRKALTSKDATKSAWKILWIFEQHDLTNADIGYILSMMIHDRTSEHNQFLKDTVGKEIVAFQDEIETIKGVADIVTQSYNHALLWATAIAFKTYVEGMPVETCVDNIRLSDIARLAKNV